MCMIRYNPMDIYIKLWHLLVMYIYLHPLLQLIHSMMPDLRTVEQEGGVILGRTQGDLYLLEYWKYTCMEPSEE